MSGLSYLDTSAFVKLVWAEPQTHALAAYLRSRPERVSSGLLVTEALRAASRIGEPAVERTLAMLPAVTLIPVSPAILRSAGTLGGPPLRSLDAIHLVTAMTCADDLEVFVTYDSRLRTAAESAGLHVANPS